ncbi:MAG: hypothetical protein ACK4EX_03465 [Thermaurantimonas sp.]|uniref:hypothetical protein n=1 Tax=Thermaurantimonas sp. TaxID=2681568 RepID=UPI00391AB573
MSRNYKSVSHTLLLLSMVLTLLISSCSGLKISSKTFEPDRGTCYQHSSDRRYSVDELPKPFHTLEFDSVLFNRFSFRSLNVAHAIGLIDQLTALIRINEERSSNPSLEKKLEMIQLLQDINQKIHRASLEISAVASEMDCEEERADQIAAYLKGLEDQTETMLTVAAIAVGAVGAIASGILLAGGSDGNLPEFIGIGAGLTEAILATRILRQKKTIYFSHSRNALSDIWTAPHTSAIFPPSVWYYLTYENPATQENSLRQQIVDKWLGFGQLADIRDRDREKIYKLFFGDGGIYTAEQLANRANMYDQIEAQVNLMKQDLKLLVSELERFLNK